MKSAPEPPDRSDDPSGRFQWLLWRLLVGYPTASVRVWPLVDVGCMVGWDIRGQLIALALPLLPPSPDLTEISASTLLQALQQAETSGNSKLSFDDYSPVTTHSMEIDLTALTPVGVITGEALEHMITLWVAETNSDPDRTFVLLPSDPKGSDESVLVIIASEIVRLGEYYPFIDQEHVTLAVDDQQRPVFLGERTAVRFTCAPTDDESV